MKEESLYDGSNPYGDDGSNESALWEGKRAERSSKLWKSVCVLAAGVCKLQKRSWCFRAAQDCKEIIHVVSVFRMS